MIEDCGKVEEQSRGERDFSFGFALNLTDVLLKEI